MSRASIASPDQALCPAQEAASALQTPSLAGVDLVTGLHGLFEGSESISWVPLLLDLNFGSLVGGTLPLVETPRIRLSVRFPAEALRVYILIDSRPTREHDRGPQLGHSRTGNHGSMRFAP